MTVIVVIADCPAAIVADVGKAEIVKLGAATTIEIVLETLARFAPSPA